MRWAQRTATLLAAGLLAGCGLFSPEPGARATGDAAVQKARALRELEGLRPGAHDLRAVPGLTAPALAPPPEMAAGRPRPDWVRTGVSAQFPPPVEVAGTGSCDRGRGNAYSALSTAEDRARVFEPLYTTKAKGFGLGLSIVKLLVDAHGGTVTVSSTPGAGSCFSVHLPIAQRPT